MEIISHFRCLFQLDFLSLQKFRFAAHMAHVRFRAFPVAPLLSRSFLPLGCACYAPLPGVNYILPLQGMESVVDGVILFTSAFSLHFLILCPDIAK
jgi:hypothetical protein